MKQQLEHWPIERLIEYDRNPRKNDHAVDKVAAAIKEYGFRVPVVAKSDGLVIDGHLRLKAAKKLGLAEVPVLLADDLSEAQIKAFRLSVNKVAELADWDNELLRLEFTELEDMCFDLSLTGFDPDEIAALTQEEGTEGLTDDDAVPEVPAQPVTVEGDVWLLGRHRLMCGDSTSIDNCEILVSDKNCDMVFTDPMYNDCTKGFTNAISSLNINHIVLMTTFKQAISILRDTGWEFKFDCVLYFKTPSSMMNKKVPYYLHKNVFYVTTDQNVDSIFHCDNAKGAFSDAGYYPSVIESKKNTQEEHGLSKPVEAIIQIISGYAAKNLVDLFGGSGSTLIACEKTNRSCFMMELDPKYCDVIIKRWQDFTGQSATLEGDGRTFDEIAGAREAA